MEHKKGLNRIKRFRKRQLLVLFFLLLMLLQACSQGDDKKGSADTNASPGATSGGASEATSSGGSGGTLVVAMTSSDVPTLDVVPSQGLEAYKFIGFQLYDGLIAFDPLNADEIIPGLAKSWEADGKDWTFHLREGVKFQDGTPWNADAAIFNLDRLMKKDFEYYSKEMAGGASTRISSIASYKKVDDMTIVLTTKNINSFFISEIPYVLFASPDAVKKYGDDYLNHPVGTGPFKFEELQLRQFVSFTANKDYWKEPAKLDKYIVRPMADPASRYAALRAGEVQWIEVPPPDAIPEMEASGFQIITQPYAHVWLYQVNMAAPPFNDARVREAFLLAIDKAALCKDLLHGACEPANSMFASFQKWYPTDAKTYEYNPEKAKQLLTEAGYANGVKATIQMPSSGSGNMWPLPMSEFIQMNLKKVGFDVKFDVLDWNTLSSSNKVKIQADAFETSRGMRAPTDFERNFINLPPGGSNNMGYKNETYEKLVNEAKLTFDLTKQDALLKSAAKELQNDMPWLSIVHDLNLKALSPKVKGFQPPNSWFADIRSIWVE